MPRIEVIKETCKGCQLCVPACPHDLIFYTKSEINQMGFYPVEYVDPDQKCTACKLCAIICPDVAIRVYK
jgi:2-oxoglutarate ferredoxin oxidoreductase subunit delta